MMDCKRALEETGGDIEAARMLLRERGMANAAKRAGRETTEGLVGYRISDDARDDGRASAARPSPSRRTTSSRRSRRRCSTRSTRDGVDAVDGLDEERQELIGKLGENIVVAGAGALRGGRRRRARGLRPSAGEQARRARAAPRRQRGARAQARDAHRGVGAAVDRRATTCPRRPSTAEREIYANSDEVLSKPEQAREKIVEGMLNKRFFAAQVLNEQPWIHDTTKTVGQALADEGAEVLEFERFALAG